VPKLHLVPGLNREGCHVGCLHLRHEGLDAPGNLHSVFVGLIFPEHAR